MATLDELLDTVLQYEVQLKGIYLILGLISVLVGIYVKLKWKPKMHKWFQEWLIHQEAVIERKRSKLAILVGLVLIIAAVAGAEQTNGGSLLLILPGLFLILRKKVRIRTRPMKGGKGQGYPMGPPPGISGPPHLEPVPPRSSEVENARQDPYRPS